MLVFLNYAKNYASTIYQSLLKGILRSRLSMFCVVRDDSGLRASPSHAMQASRANREH